MSRPAAKDVSGAAGRVQADVQPTDLLGRWLLERRVHDRRAGVFGRVEGTLSLSAHGDDVRWIERGVLGWDGRALQVTRELHIVRVPQTPREWMVHFEDGREFHPWSPSSVVVHPCREDLYRGLIDVDASLARLRVVWDVLGPAKSQRLVTRCRRLVSPRDACGSSALRPAG